MDNDIHESCGVAAVHINSSTKPNNRALFYLYRMLLNLQNRGQLSAGVTTYNPTRPQLLETYRDIGTVNEVFRTSNPNKSFDIFKEFAGSKGIGHVRYATCGSDDRTYAQPFERRHGRLWKWFSFGFNGNIANFVQLKDHLVKKKNYHISLEGDTEVLMHYLARQMMGPKKPNTVHVFSNLSKLFDGAYNITFINGYGDLAIVRDPLGFKPLCFGSKNGIFAAASESNALVNCGIEKYHSLEPGKMILIQGDDIKIKRYAKSPRKAHCMFEWVYFANVGSVLDDRSVYITRNLLGKELAKLETEKITKDHIVVPVPDTAKASADAMAYELGIPVQEGLIRNRFVGRTFIEGASRSSMVENKYTAIPRILKGKKIILVDDSIVRGTTSKQIVHYLKRKGAREVHLRIACPAIKSPCFYGIDMSTISELLVPRYKKRMDVDEISQETCKKIVKDLGADSLIYQTIEGLIKALRIPKRDLCMACLNSKYPTKYGRELFNKALKNKSYKMCKRTYE